jgi:signal transduction histidine kinase
MIKNKLSRQIVLPTIGILLFMALFFVMEYVFTGYIFGSAFDYDYFVYAFFGMPILIAILAFMMVRYKMFNIKILGAQVLVISLVSIIGAEFFFIQNTVSDILTAITLVISGWLGLIIVRSVKKEVAQREELALANENQQLLIRFITHQVKGFFTKSKMIFASIVEGDLGEVSAPLKDLMNQGLESDNKAVDMVQEVLKASSLRTGQMTYNLEEVNMTDFVKPLAEGYRETAVAKGLVYEVNLPTNNADSTNTTEVKVDKLQLTQVIKNLIDNSVKYTLTGFVKVNLEVKEHSYFDKKSGPVALFSIVDSGVGLSDSDKAKLFKEGGRGEESLKVNVNSTGYGLFIVKKIVEGHGGRIWATSEGRGHGSSFCVEIPTIAR